VGHVELPIEEAFHITLVHFPRALTGDEGAIVLRGMEHVGKRGIDLELRWLTEEMFGRYKKVKARTVEDYYDTLHKMRADLVSGLKHFGIPISEDYGEWVPHITNPPHDAIPWQRIIHHPKLVLVQKPQGRFEVPFR